jgi:hypothetical protein
LKTGENTLLVRVTDATDTAYQLHGKQVLNPNGIWYTPVSGIWQTVWMEEVPWDYIYSDGIWCETKVDGTVVIHIRVNGSVETIKTRITASLDGKPVFEGEEYRVDWEFKIPDPKPWSPEQPTLYDLRIEYGPDTVVETYVGLRETTVVKDADGHLRLHLNGATDLPLGHPRPGLVAGRTAHAAVRRGDALGHRVPEGGGLQHDPQAHQGRAAPLLLPLRPPRHDDLAGPGELRHREETGRGEQQPAWTRLAAESEGRDWPDEAHAQYMRELEAHD